MEDRFDLERFIRAQDADGVFDRVLAELRNGRKTSHWMWFVFPQIAGLGSSLMSKRYAISCLEEAKAYGNHPVLGARLVLCSSIIVATENADASQILGVVDSQKLHSSMTLFLRADPGVAIYQQVLDKFFDGDVDSRTVELL